MDILRADPGMTAKFIEEVLRLEAPVQGMYRAANVDYEMGGVTIKKGDAALLWFAGANRDPERYPEPHAVDPGRPKVMKHLAFGIGPHFCLGAPLARLEGRIAIQTLLARLDNIRLAEGEDIDRLAYAPDYQTRHISELNLRFTQRSARDSAPAIAEG